MEPKAGTALGGDEGLGAGSVVPPARASGCRGALGLGEIQRRGHGRFWSKHGGFNRDWKQHGCAGSGEPGTSRVRWLLLLTGPKPPRPGLS